MTALSDALEQAQTRAVAVLAKQYVGGAADEAEVAARLDAVGLTDAIDRGRWLAALDVIREGGGEAPAETNGTRKDDPMSDKQRDYILKLCSERNLEPPDSPLTKSQASEIIDSIDRGTYDPAKWKVPF